jgi:transcriptional regulator with XRE-family HTH domain
MPRVNRKKALTLAQKVELLLGLAHEKLGAVTSYPALAKATGSAMSNIQDIRSGRNKNPGYQLLDALARYCGTDLGYFSRTTEDECRAYFEESVTQKDRVQIAMRSKGLSKKSRESIRNLINLARRAEGLPDMPDDEEP